MPDPSTGRFENMGRKVDERLGSLTGRVEEDLHRIIAFLNDRVVPEVRQNSSSALRAAAEQLNRLAEHLESRTRSANPPGSEDRHRQ